jgi:putative methyltransferase (TIGR04325 family)
MTDKLKSMPSFPLWDGPYATWDEACNAAKNQNISQPAFTGERWKQRITQQLLDYRTEFNKYAIAQPPRTCNLVWVVALTKTRSIIDFGGSSGWALDYLQNTLKSHKLDSYTILELDAIATYMQNSKLHADNVNYQTLDSPRKSCELLYSNSVLQYLGSNSFFVSLIESTTPKYIFLEDLYAKGKKDFFGTQTYYDQTIPVRFIGLEDLIEELRSLGYHQILQCPYLSPIHGSLKNLPMQNYPVTYQLRYSLSILLEKRPRC